MMKAALFDVNQPVNVKEIETPEPGERQVRIKLIAAALNHRDVWMQKGMYPGSKNDIITGSDGYGVIDAVGEGVDSGFIGKEAIINPSLNWGDDERAQSPDFKILGNPDPGTLAQYIVVPFENVHPKPKHLNSAEAAALPLAGLTAYRALFSRAGLTEQERVLINGIGGGVALIGMQMAIAWGAEVHVTSSSPGKREHALKMGATSAIDYTEDGWGKQAARDTGGFDVILDGASGPGFEELLDALNPGGRIALYGRTAGPLPQLQSAKIFYKQASIMGSTMGSSAEFTAMLDLVSREEINPVIDSRFALEQTEEAFRYMEAGKQFGKIVITID